MGAAFVLQGELGRATTATLTPRVVERASQHRPAIPGAGAGPQPLAVSRLVAG